jgi:hypothetical protein
MTTNHVQMIDRYLSAADCTELLESIEAFRKTHTLPFIHREVAGRSLHYSVIDGDLVHEHFPELTRLYGRVQQVVKQHFGDDLVPYPNRAVTVNVNITPPGGEYRWHYDRNPVTAILYLNTVPGGETEMYPGHRIHLGRWKNSGLQQRLDRLVQWALLLRLSGKHTIVSPEQGLLVMMRGDRCLHSVRRVEGSQDRINVIMSFDTPHARVGQQKNLDSYLYSDKPAPSSDPNYKQ